MPLTPQKRAIKNYRSRLRKIGIVRFEVLGLESDRELIRSLAKRLTQNDSEAMQIRSDVREAVLEKSAARGGILAALRRSPLVGTELEIIRAKEAGRRVDL